MGVCDIGGVLPDRAWIFRSGSFIAPRSLQLCLSQPAQKTLLGGVLLTEFPQCGLECSHPALPDGKITQASQQSDRLVVFVGLPPTGFFLPHGHEPVLADRLRCVDKLCQARTECTAFCCSKRRSSPFFHRSPGPETAARSGPKFNGTETGAATSTRFSSIPRKLAQRMEGSRDHRVSRFSHLSSFAWEHGSKHFVIGQFQRKARYNSRFPQFATQRNVSKYFPEYHGSEAEFRD
jgi:hypothetical protein